MKHILPLLFVFFFAQNSLHAQTYRGCVMGDIPAILEIKPVKGEERAFIKIVGKKKGWSGLEVDRQKEGITLKRDKPAENITFPIWLRDISKEYDCPLKSIYAGVIHVKATQQGQQDYFKEVLFILDGLK